MRRISWDTVVAEPALHVVLCELFFFQAEDGIRDKGNVTRVQTCALPIWFVARAIYHAGKVAGYLERRNFLVKRRLLLRTAVWVDGHPLDDVGAVWIETNGFDEWERERIR